MKGDEMSCSIIKTQWIPYHYQLPGFYEWPCYLDLFNIYFQSLEILSAEIVTVPGHKFSFIKWMELIK